MFAFKIYFIFVDVRLCVCMCSCGCLACEDQKRESPGAGATGLWYASCGAGTLLRSSAGATGAPNHWANPLAHKMLFLID